MSTVEELVHHGVKGMRWGVRRSGVNIGKIYRKPGAKAPTSDDFKKAQAAKAKIGVTKVGKTAKKTAPLANDELQSLVKRMNLEKQYAELSQRDKRKVVGAKFVGDLIGGTASGIVKGQATRVGNQLAAQQIDKLLKNARGK